MANLKRFNNLEPEQKNAENENANPKLWQRKIEMEGEARLQSKKAAEGGLDSQIEEIERQSKYTKRKQELEALESRGTIEEQKAALRSQIAHGQKKFWKQILIVLALTILVIIAFRYKGTREPILRHIGMIGAVIALVSSFIAKKNANKE